LKYNDSFHADRYAACELGVSQDKGVQSMKRPIFGYVLLLLFAASIVYAASLQKDAITTAEVVPFALGVLSVVVLWFWMISNYFANRKRIKHSACWGWFLFLANWVAAIIYFFAMYKPAESKPRDYFHKFREWITAESKGIYGFYSKLALVSFAVAVFHHMFMDVLYRTINLFDYEIYRDFMGVIYFPFKAFMMLIYGLLNIDINHNREQLVLFARTMRFIYTFSLFYIVALLLFRFDKNRTKKSPVLGR
jgi:hypothetical protein